MKKLRLPFLLLVLLPCLGVHLQAATSIKVALILDTSNSMDGLIDQAKSQLWSVVNELSNARCDGDIPELEIALYEYGNDALPMREGYIRLVSSFTSDLDLISEKLFALRTDGGSEYCGHVIQTTLKQLDWEEYPKDLKLIFIAGNEAFDQGKISYREVCKTARDHDITVNTIFCGPFKEGVNTHWKDGAYIGGGDYMNIDQDCKYVHIKSPYDDRIMEMNQELNKTYIAYGPHGKKAIARQSEQDMNAYDMNTSVAIKRTSSKSLSAYKNTHWDLVDASSESGFSIESIDIESLPEEMRELSQEEKLDYIASKKEERAVIQAEIKILSSKRDAYVSSKRAEDEGANMLDQVIIQAVKKQAIAKNYHFQ